MKSTIEASISKHFILTNEAISESNQEDIQEFVSIFSPKFRINWSRDNTLVVRNRHNKKGGANLLIEFRSRHTANVDPDQMELFESEKEEDNVLELKNSKN